MTGIERATPYEYEVNICKEEFEDIDSYDEWGVAVLHPKTDDLKGVEYNLCMDEGENFSAIYMLYADQNDYLNTDGNTYWHYEIDWADSNWKQKLVKEMWEAFKYFEKDGYYE